MYHRALTRHLCRCGDNGHHGGEPGVRIGPGGGPGGRTTITVGSGYRGVHGLARGGCVGRGRARFGDDTSALAGGARLPARPGDDRGHRVVDLGRLRSPPRDHSGPTGRRVLADHLSQARGRPSCPHCPAHTSRGGGGAHEPSARHRLGPRPPSSSSTRPTPCGAPSPRSTSAAGTCCGSSPSRTARSTPSSPRSWGCRSAASARRGRAA